MIKVKKVTEEITHEKPYEAICDRCKTVFTPDDCDECLYSKLIPVVKVEGKMMHQFEICADCFDELVERDNIDMRSEHMKNIKGLNFEDTEDQEEVQDDTE